MPSTFVNPRVNSAINLGIQSLDETEPIRLWQNASDSEIEVVIRATYRQVLGNAHVMESERLTVAESQLKRGDISVREFVRQIAQSDLYRTLFVESCPRTRSIELNFKHLLGRAPESHEELAVHAQILDQYGLKAEIDSYLDSDEYLESFGETVVPYCRGYKTQLGKKIVNFTHIFQLLRGSASSDKDPVRQNRSRLNSYLMADRPSVITPLKGSPTPWQSPGVAMDFNQLLAQVLGLKSGAPDRSFAVEATTSIADSLDRSNQFYQAYQPFKDADPIELYPGSSAVEINLVIRAAYRQVFGNAYIMESERLTVAESQLQRGELSVREFIRHLAKSSLYRSRFFDTCNRYRAIELNYKHLLGRAPDSFEEMRHHSAILDQHGFDADIDSYLDSDEYQSTFGEFTVPYYRGYQTQAGRSLLEFTNMFQLLRSASSSDQDRARSNSAQLTRAVIQNSPYGKAKVRDINAMLAEVLRPKPGVTRRISAQGTSAAGVAESTGSELALQQTLREQAQTIAQLQQTLADLSPAASIGAIYLRNDWRPSTSTTGNSDASSLRQQLEAQTVHIAALNEQIADARRYATIGEARLNRWRRRSFRG